MDTRHAHAAPVPPAATAGAPLEASDDAGNAAPARYCPTELIARFTLLMAGHGRCAHADMMLGDREYAMWQLACARATGDPELVSVAARLFDYFDDAQHSGLVVTGTA